MSSLWIVHRDPRVRAAVARLVAASDDSVLGGPSDHLFDSAPEPDAVLLGASGDFEEELEFAHRQLPRVREAAWILLADPEDLAEARRLFDTLGADLLAFPAPASELRRALRAALGRRRSDALSQRRARDALAARFARWFADLDMPELLRALDPQLGAVPLLVLGEPGSGRELLARYVHAFGGTAGGELIHLPCTPDTRVEDLRAGLAAWSQRERDREACAIWLQDLEKLPVETQLQLRSWIEFAPPEGTLRTSLSRWIGTASEAPPPSLDPALAQALAGISIRIPPLCERTAAIEPLVRSTAEEWCRERGEPPRRFAEDALAALREHPWPGNLRELEAVVVETLAAHPADPVRAEDLRAEGRAFAGPALVRAMSAGPAPPAELEPEQHVAAPVEDEGDARAPDAPEEELAPAPPPREAPGPVESGEDLRRLVGAVAHEVRNPLVSIRTLSDLLPAQYDDAEFRDRFSRLVGAGVRRIEEVVERLGRLAALKPSEPGTVDVAALCEALLDARREEVQDRRLLVLKELDHSQPLALADPDQLQFAFEALINKVLDLVPDRGDVYLASKHHAQGLRDGPGLRVLIRFRSPAALASVRSGESLAVADHALEFVLAELLVRAQSGTLNVSAPESGETVIVIDLPAPAQC